MTLKCTIFQGIVGVIGTQHMAHVVFQNPPGGNTTSLAHHYNPAEGLPNITVNSKIC